MKNITIEISDLMRKVECKFREAGPGAEEHIAFSLRDAYHSLDNAFALMKSIEGESFSLAEQHLIDIIEEPSRTLKQKQKTVPYKAIQRRADFIINFENGWELYRTNSTFNKIANMVMNGASEYDVLLDLILYLDKNPFNETK